MLSWWTFSAIPSALQEHPDLGPWYPMCIKLRTNHCFLRFTTTLFACWMHTRASMLSPSSDPKNIPSTDAIKGFQWAHPTSASRGMSYALVTWHHHQRPVAITNYDPPNMSKKLESKQLEVLRQITIAIMNHWQPSYHYISSLSHGILVIFGRPRCHGHRQASSSMASAASSTWYSAAALSAISSGDFTNGLMVTLMVSWSHGMLWLYERLYEPLYGFSW